MPPVRDVRRVLSDGEILAAINEAAVWDEYRQHVYSHFRLATSTADLANSVEQLRRNQPRFFK